MPDAASATEEGEASRGPEPAILPPEAGAALLRWFYDHRRDLPWRRTRDPYAIWISEIMLQQTRVAAVLDHYTTWMQRFPSVDALAIADEAEVLAVWSGLGYYRRARMLRQAAQVVAAEHGGVIPRSAAGLLRLPGIGAYTSAAVASIAYGERIPVVDGNVERLVTRLLGLAPAVSSSARVTPELNLRLTPAERARAVRAGAATLLVSEAAGDTNQAMMELGATVCLPRAPLCLSCPMLRWCKTRGEHVVSPRKPQTTRSAVYGLAEHDGAVLLRQRPGDASLMGGMWELPELSEAPAEAEVLLRLRHAITVTNYAVSVVRLTPELMQGVAGPVHWTSAANLPRLPLTGLARKVLRRLDFLSREIAFDAQLSS